MTTQATPTAEQLRDQFGYWGEHPEHKIHHWIWEINEDNTRQGYWDWVASELENDLDR